MYDLGLLLALFSICYLAFAAFAIAQKKHWQALYGTQPYRPHVARRLRFAGVVMLLMSAALAFLRDGPDYGAVVWVTMLSFAALSVALTIAFSPQGLRALMCLTTMCQTGKNHV